MPYAVVGVNGKPCQRRHTTTSSWLKSVVSLFPHLHTPSPLFFPSLISLMVLWTLSTMFTYLCFLSAPPTSISDSALFNYVFCRPAYLQHYLSPTYLCFMFVPLTSNSLSPTYLCFLSAPLTSNSVTAYLRMFSVGPAYLQHCLIPTYLCFFSSAPLTSSRVSASASLLDVDSLLPPCEWGGWREEEEGEGC